jgi:hypothetical protein
VDRHERYHVECGRGGSGRQHPAHRRLARQRGRIRGVRLRRPRRHEPGLVDRHPRRGQLPGTRQVRQRRAGDMAGGGFQLRRRRGHSRRGRLLLHRIVQRRQLQRTVPGHGQRHRSPRTVLGGLLGRRRPGGRMAGPPGP